MMLANYQGRKIAAAVTFAAQYAGAGSMPDEPPTDHMLPVNKLINMIHGISGDCNTYIDNLPVSLF